MRWRVIASQTLVTEYFIEDAIDKDDAINQAQSILPEGELIDNSTEWEAEEDES